MEKTIDLTPISNKIKSQSDRKISKIFEEARGNFSSVVLSKVYEEFEQELTQIFDTFSSAGNSIDEIETAFDSTLERALDLLSDQFRRRNLGDTAAYENERNRWTKELEETRDALIVKFKISLIKDSTKIATAKSDSKTDIASEQSNTTHPDGIVSATTFENFSHSLLGIGDLNLPSKRIDAVSAVLDLQEFTAFSQQEDPDLAVQPFISEFVRWFFEKLKELAFIEQKNQLVYSRIPLPFFAKFLGDGFMLIWDLNLRGTQQICNEKGHNWKNEVQRYIGNILTILFELKDLYKDDFIKELRFEFPKIPKKLRCGVARGSIYSIGGDKDYVGPCINKAARLANIPPLNMLFSAKGITIEKTGSEKLIKRFAKSTINLKGIGDEFVYVNRYEYGQLPDEDKKLIRLHQRNK